MFKCMTMRGLLVASVCLGLVHELGAQNGSNYHVLNNGYDVSYLGVGAGGQQGDQDGLGTWIPGESINGGTLGAGGLPTYKQTRWAESVCLYSFGGATTGNLQFPLITLTELNRAPFPTTYDPIVFTPFADPTGTCFPLGNSAGFVSYGAPGGSSASFVFGTLPSGCGTGAILLPNEALVASGFGGYASLLACATGVNLTIASTGFCWGVQFTWIPSAVESLAFPTGGWWHYLRNGQDGNQYWALSDDELNAWQSNTVGSDGGQTAVQTFLANVEGAYLSATADPFTNVAIQPAGVNGSGPYYFQTENIGHADGIPGANPNGGFDLGGHQTLSLSGACGVPHPVTGFGNQDPAGVGGVNPNGSSMVPTFGVWTFDSTPWPSGSPGGGAGGKRVTWITWNSDATFNTDPNLTTWLYLANGSVKVPSPMPATSVTWPQPLTANLLALLTHEVDLCPSGCPTPVGFSFAGVPQGGSGMVPTLSAPALATGLEIALVIGTSALEGEPGQATGGLVWNNQGWSPSGTTTIYVTN